MLVREYGSRMAVRLLRPFANVDSSLQSIDIYNVSELGAVLQLQLALPTDLHLLNRILISVYH